MEQLKSKTIIRDGEHSYTLEEYIGSGSYGEVWKATDDAAGEEVAIKFYIMLDERGREEFMSEYQIAYGLHHKNLLTASYLGTWEKRPFLVMRYCPKGSASHLVGNLEPTPENENLLWRFIRDVASGLACLHSQEPDPIVHQDIKPDNILMDTDGNFVITDFGISKKIRSTMRSQSNRSAKAGAVAYMGPERFSSHPAPIMASDIWSLGASIYEIAMGELPFYGQGGNMLRNGADMPEVDPRWSEDLRNVIYLCLAKEPWDRIKAYELEEFAQNILDSRLAGSAGFDPRKTRRKVTPDQPAVPVPPVQEAVEPAPKPSKKKHLKGWLIGAAALVAAGVFAVWYVSGADKRLAKRNIDHYMAFVRECEENIDAGDARNYALLLAAQELSDSVLSYESRFYAYYPKVYDNFYRLQKALDDKKGEAALAWARAAKSQKAIGNTGNAVEYYGLARRLASSGDSLYYAASNEFWSLAQAMAYMKTEDIIVEYMTESGNFQDCSDGSVRAKDVNSIRVSLRYEGLLTDPADMMVVDSASVQVKFYGGWDGALSLNADVGLAPYSQTAVVALWAYDEGGTYSPGSYRVEIWSEDMLLRTKSFKLK